MRRSARLNNDFEAWNADVVVVNLGANDSSAFEQGPWTDPETGIAYKQRKKRGWYPQCGGRPKALRRDAEFPDQDPQAQSACLPDLGARHVLQHADRSGHEHGGGIQAHNGRCARRSLPDAGLPASGVGARNHPGLPMHEVAAQALAEEILTLE